MSSLLGTLGVKLTANVKDLVKGLDKGESKLDAFAAKAQKVAIPAAAAFIGIGAGIAFSIKQASDAEEQLNVLSQSFGKKLTPAVQEWANVSGDAMGRSRLAMQGMAGDMQSLLAPMLGAKDLAAPLSMGLAQLAVDLGSFNNVADEDAFIALRSGMIGSSEPMLAFGVDLREAALQAFALKEGINVSVKAMTAGQKGLLRYASILSQTADKQGDAVRTADGLANAMKGVAGNVINLAERFGTNFLPIAGKVVGRIRDMVGWLAKLSPETKSIISGVVAFSFAVTGLTAAIWGLMAVAPFIASTVGAIAAPLLAVAGILFGIILIVGAVKQAWVGDLGGMRTALNNFANDIAFEFKEIVKKIKPFIDAMGEALVLVKAFASGKSVDAAYKDLRTLRMAGGAADILGAGSADSKGVLNDIAEAVKKDGIDPLISTLKQGVGVFTSIFDKAKTQAEKDKTLQLQDELGKTLDKLKDFKEGVTGATKAISIFGEDIDRRSDRLDAALDAPAVQTFSVGGLKPNTQSFREAKAASFKLGPTEQQQAVKNTALANAGDVAATGQEIATGFQAGLFAGIAAAIFSLLKRLDEFTSILDMASAALTAIAGIFKPFLEIVKPSLDAFTMLTTLLTPIINLLLRLDIGMGFLIVTAEALGKVFNSIFKALARTFNSFINGIAKFLDDLHLGPIAKSMRKLLIDVNQFDAPKEEALKDPAALPTTKLSEFGDALDKAAEATEQLLNGPSGFKAAFRRFDASERDSVVSLDGGDPAFGGIGSNQRDGKFQIHADSVSLIDSTGILSMVEEAQEFDIFQSSGGMPTGNSPYGNDTKGA